MYQDLIKISSQQDKSQGSYLVLNIWKIFILYSSEWKLMEARHGDVWNAVNAVFRDWEKLNAVLDYPSKNLWFLSAFLSTCHLWIKGPDTNKIPPVIQALTVRHEQKPCSVITVNRYYLLILSVILAAGSGSLWIRSSSDFLDVSRECVTFLLHTILNRLRIRAHA